MTQANGVPAGVDTTTASPARMYNYMLGGQHNFAVDREATEQLRAQMPELADAAWANRSFHGRAAIWMAKRGIRQFLDIGAGLPMQNNTHQAVHKIAPAARVVYVDYDPMMSALGGELCVSNGTTAVIQADLRDPDGVLGNPDLRALIDFSRPAGLLMTAVMQCGAEVYGRTTQTAYPRDRAEVARFFEGLELVSPGPGMEPALTHPGMWGPRIRRLRIVTGRVRFIAAWPDGRKAPGVAWGDHRCRTEAVRAPSVADRKWPFRGRPECPQCSAVGE
jgi:S-adenosyl methyltransferase